MRWFAGICCMVWLVPGMTGEVAAQVSEPGLRRLQRATVRIVSGDDLSSGVLISASGHVLTVAHGLREPPAEITILLHDGSRQAATLVLMDRADDLAVLKIVPIVGDASTPTFVPLAASLPRAAAGAVVFACGYPARVRDQSAGLPRLGTLRAVDSALLRSSCQLTVGDSGGPLLNMAGQLIGVHRQIGMGRDANVHVSVTRIRQRLQANPALRQLAESASSTSLLSEMPQELSAAQRGALANRTVGVAAQGTQSERLTEWRPGIRLAARRVVAKRSELPPECPLACRLSSGLVIPCRVLLVDVALDVVVLELEPEADSAIPAVDALPVAIVRPGELVFAVLGQTADGGIRLSDPGIAGRVGYREPGLPLKLGAVIDEMAGVAGTVLRVREISPNGPAAVAGLAAGDRLIAVEGRSLATLNDLAEILAERQPGDQLQLQLDRAGQSVSLSLIAGHDPGAQFEKLEYLDGRAGAVSGRRSGFVGVIQHDIPVTPAECGGWLINSRGELLGMTIARRSREATLAIPIQTLLDLIEGGRSSI